MKKSRTFNLLSKTTFIYLLFTFIAFFSSALFLTHETDEFIDYELAHRFEKSEHRLKHFIESGKSIDRLPSSLRLTLLADSTKMTNYPVYRDTLVYNTELDEMHNYRKKITVIESSGQFYRIELTKSIHDYFRLRDDILGSMIPAFILLALGVVLFNYFPSGYLFQPFNSILRLMQTYKVGERRKIGKIETSSTEFRRMQDLFHQMIDRIEDDYQNLKEYTENMAHEIQTPLTIVRNKTENLIADEAVMERQAETIKIIYEESIHLSKLGNTLNLITKIENNEFSNATRVRTKPVIEKHLAGISELVQLKSLALKTDLNEKHEFYIDPYLLDIIFKNLLRNAVIYGTNDSPIRIETTSDRLAISNYGPPLNFPAEKIFQRFRRNHQSKMSLGLGLALVQKICVLNNLRIDYKYKDEQHIFEITESH
ncbi:hypothetical protein GF337_04640 [candidate division KSB1 bacterium]|nr:hypothetical protein [candidate division KSB1 bacterium]